jgi:hypothetical protein
LLAEIGEYVQFLQLFLFMLASHAEELFVGLVLHQQLNQPWLNLVDLVSAQLEQDAPYLVPILPTRLLRR